MPIKYIKGNLFEHVREGDCIIHVCNDVNKWGSGFVVPLGERYPAVREAYHKWADIKEMVPMDVYLSKGSFIHCYTGPPTLGNIQAVYVPEPHEVMVVNMIAQKGVIGPDTPTPIKYDALEECLAAIRSTITLDSKRIIAPLIGSGLAGGKWSFISKIIEKIFYDKEVTIYYLNEIPKG